MKRNRKKYTVLISIVLILVMMLSLTGCGGYRVGGKALEEVKIEDMDFAEKIYERVMVVFKDGIVENLNGLSQSSKVTYEEVWAEWESMKEMYGDFQSYEVDCAYLYGEDTVAIGYVNLENGRIAVDRL